MHRISFLVFVTFWLCVYLFGNKLDLLLWKHYPFSAFRFVPWWCYQRICGKWRAEHSTACFIIRKFQLPHNLLPGTSKRSSSIMHLFSSILRSLVQIRTLNHIHWFNTNVCLFVIHVGSLILYPLLFHPRGLFSSGCPNKILYKNPLSYSPVFAPW